MFAYEVTELDVENVLRSNCLAVANTNGKSFESMASEIFPSLDFSLIEDAALVGDDLDQQTDYAYDEIARQLRQQGVLEPLKEAVVDHPITGAKDVRPEVVSELAKMVIDQASEHRFPVEVDAIRGAVDQFVKFSGIGATEEEIVAACNEAERLASDVVIRVELVGEAGRETVEFNALDVLKYHEEPRTWQELVLDEEHQHLQMSLAEDYALYHFRRKFGDKADCQVTILSGLSDLAPAVDVPPLIVQRG